MSSTDNLVFSIAPRSMLSLDYGLGKVKVEKQDLSIKDEPIFVYRIVAMDGTKFLCRINCLPAEAEGKLLILQSENPDVWDGARIEKSSVADWVYVKGGIDDLASTSADKLREIVNAEGV